MTGRTVVYALFFYSCEQIDLICSSSMLPLAAFSPFHIIRRQAVITLPRAENNT